MLLVLLFVEPGQTQALSLASIQLSAATYSVNETDGTATVRVMRTGSLASGDTVQFTTTNGTATAPADYLDATQVLTFAAGEGFKDVPITIVDDAVAEGTGPSS